MRRAALLVMGAALAAGCGVRQDDAPRAVDDAEVPFDLLEPSSPSTSEPVPLPGAVDVNVFLVGPDGRLVRAARPVTAPVTASRVIRALLEEVSPDEQALGYTSAVPAGTTFIDTETLLDGTLTINLSEELFAVRGEGLRRALAQVVFTAFSLPDVDQVQFEIEDVPVPVPSDTGQELNRPVRRSDFADFREAEVG